MTVGDRIVTANDQIDAAIADSRAGDFNRAVSVTYDPGADKVSIELADGLEFRVPRMKLQGLGNATREELSDIQIEGPGTGLFWPQLDVSHYVPGLLDGVFGTRRYMRQLGRIGGSKTSASKAAAARRNGKKGGRKAAPRN